jgi:FHA domain
VAEQEDDPEKTRLIRRPARKQPPQPPPLPEDVAGPSDKSELTRLITVPRPSPGTGVNAPEEKTAAPDDPVVGWVVVVDGPGRGNALRLGYGQNGIGRDQAERVCLDFGDDAISRQKHCFLIYEPRRRQFLVRPGDGAALTYLNGNLLSQPRQLKAADKIEIGRTTLRFVPLCGPDFEWRDQPR